MIKNCPNCSAPLGTSLNSCPCGWREILAFQTITAQSVASLEAIDYKKILIAYMKHVGECEGIDFLSYGPNERLEGLNDAESVELAKIRDSGRWPDNRFYK